MRCILVVKNKIYNKGSDIRKAHSDSHSSFFLLTRINSSREEFAIPTVFSQINQEVEQRPA